MEVPIYSGNTQIGVLRAEQKGLYTQFYGRLQQQLLCRVFGVFSQGECSLGVPVPEQGRLILRASVPTSRLPGGRLLSGRVVCGENQFFPFSGGRIGGVMLPAGLRKGNVFRFPWRTGDKLPAEEFMCFFRPVRENGKLYLELHLKEDGTPEV